MDHNLAMAIVRSAGSRDRLTSTDYVPHIYFLYSAGMLKVGTSLYVTKRARSIQGQSALPVTVILTGPGDVKDERELHEILAAYRHHDEWFRITPEVRNMLKGMLCARGWGRFKRAEAQFRAWIREQHAAL